MSSTSMPMYPFDVITVVIAAYLNFVLINVLMDLFLFGAVV